MKVKFVWLFLPFLFFGCSKSLIHTWNIDKFEIIRENGQSTGSDNIGTITFNKNGSGHKDINYTIFDHQYSDKSGFKWEKHEGYILLKSTKSEDKSKLNKAWIILEDGAKKQIWKSTNGEHQIEVLQLSRN